MIKRRQGIGLVLVTLVLSIAVQAPARLLASAVQQQYPDMRISSVSGTFWRGRAHGVVTDVLGHRMSLSNLSWQLDPMSLLLMSPRVDFEGEFGEQIYSARLSRRFGGYWLVEDLQATVPAQLLGPAIGLPVSGEISAQVPRLVIKNNAIAELEGRVVLQRVALNESGRWSQLGSFAAELAPNAEGGLVANVFDLDGAVELNSNVQVETDGSYRMDAVVAVRAGGYSVLQNWLPLVGEEISTQGDAAGPGDVRSYRIAPQGRFW